MLKNGDGISQSVSVIIPTYRRPEFVGLAVQSALAQGAVVGQVIVVDDCPEASAAATVAQFQDARVMYRPNPYPSAGRPGLVRNLGWREATGSVVHFLDDDDLVPNAFYRTALTELTANPKIGVVFGRVEPFGDVPAEVQRHTAFFNHAAARARTLQAFGSRTAYATEMTFNPVLYVGGAALIRRRCVEAMNGFDEKLQIIEDTDFFARAMSRFGARFIDQVTLHYRIGPSITRSPGIELRVRDSYVHMHRNCQAEWGRPRFLARKLLARTLLRQRRP